MAGGLPKADGIMERRGGLFYRDHPGGRSQTFIGFFFCHPGLVERPCGPRYPRFLRIPGTRSCRIPLSRLVVDTVTSLWENAKNTLQGIWSGICDIAAGAFELLKNVILAPVLLLIDLVTGNFSQAGF